jgi:hypothetical protein
MPTSIVVPIDIGTPRITFKSAIALKTRKTAQSDEDAILGEGWNAAKREAQLAICPAHMEPQISGHFGYRPGRRETDRSSRRPSRADVLLPKGTNAFLL